MSEKGWHAFLDAESTADWVVLHGGATAVFRVDSLVAATDLAQAIARLPAAAGCELLLTAAPRQLTVRLTRDIWQIEPPHIALAAAISALARQHGARAEAGAVQEVQLAIAAHAEAIDLGFWRTVLGYDALAADNAADPLGHGSTVWMQELAPGKALRHAMHVDVSVSRHQVEARLAAALAAGGRLVDASHAPSHWTLADRAGNRVCICAWPDGSAR